MPLKKHNFGALRDYSFSVTGSQLEFSTPRRTLLADPAEMLISGIFRILGKLSGVKGIL
jgi:hypothetical protein